MYENTKCYHLFMPQFYINYFYQNRSQKSIYFLNQIQQVNLLE